MRDNEKTKEQLLHELTELRSQNAESQQSIAGSISAELVAEESSRYAESIVETVREPLLVLDADLKIILVNHNFYRIFKVTPGDTIGSFIYDLGNKQWHMPTLEEMLEETLPKEEAFDDFEVSRDFQGIGHKIMLLNARRIHRKTERVWWIVSRVTSLPGLKKTWSTQSRRESGSSAGRSDLTIAQQSLPQ